MLVNVLREALKADLSLNEWKVLVAVVAACDGHNANIGEFSWQALGDMACLRCDRAAAAARGLVGKVGTVAVSVTRFSAAFRLGGGV